MELCGLGGEFFGRPRNMPKELNTTPDVLASTGFRVRRVLAWCGLLLIWAAPPVSVFGQLHHIKTAARLLNQGQSEEAEREARLALQDPDTRALAWAMLGSIRLEEGKYEEGEQFLNRALELNPRLPGARTSLGDCYVLQNKPALARASFEKALKLDPANNQARYDLAKLDASLHRYQNSLDEAQPILAQLLKSEDGLLILGTDYGALGRKEDLAEVVHAWQNLPHASDESSLDLGLLLANSGMTPEAKAMVEAAESRNQGHLPWTLAWKIGRDHLALGDLDKARQDLGLALSLNPACAACDQGLAEIAERRGNTEEALAYLVKAKQLQPEDPEVLFAFGKICLKRNLIEDALSALGKAVSLRPDDDRYVYVFGSANVARGNLPKAAELFGQLLQKHPRDAILNYAVGTVYYLEGKYIEAESAFKKSLEEQPDQVAAPYYLSLTYSHLGKSDQAEALLRGLVKSHPEYAPSYVRLGTMLMATRHYPEAQEYLERAIALDSSSGQAHYELYRLFQTLGKANEAQQHFAQWQKLQAEEHARKHLELHLLLPN